MRSMRNSQEAPPKHCDTFSVAFVQRNATQTYRIEDVVVITEPISKVGTPKRLQEKKRAHSSGGCCNHEERQRDTQTMN